MFNKLAPLFAAGAVVLLGSGCASVTVRDSNVTTEKQPVRKPARIYVQTFSTEGATVKQNPMRKNKGQLAPEAQALLSKYLVAEFEKIGIPARAVNGRAPADGWTINGRFTRIAEGSRILRMGLGLGFGGTKMETQVLVLNSAAREPFLAFSTTGGSGATPGAATNPIPFSAAPTALLNSKEGVSDDASRTARQISRRVAQYMVEHGWLEAGKVPAPKTHAPTITDPQLYTR